MPSIDNKATLMKRSSRCEASESSWDAAGLTNTQTETASTSHALGFTRSPWRPATALVSLPFSDPRASLKQYSAPRNAQRSRLAPDLLTARFRRSVAELMIARRDADRSRHDVDLFGIERTSTPHPKSGCPEDLDDLISWGFALISKHHILRRSS